MNINRLRAGRIPAATPMVLADCDVCGGHFCALVDDVQQATRAGVDHRCGTGVVGPLWTLILPPPAQAVRAVA